MLRHIVGIVSGGASGLGAATVEHIVRHGGKVVVADLADKHESYLRLATSACADAAIGRLGSAAATMSEGPVIAFAETNVTDEKQVDAALDMAEELFGEPVNASISCAGIAIAQKTLSQKRGVVDPSQKPRAHTFLDFSTSLNINAVGTFNLARLAAQRMAIRAPDSDGLRGCIINTASIAAYEGQKGQVAYAASKGAIVSMTLPMARDLAAFGIRVMSVAPGLFKTPLLDGLPQSVQDELGRIVPCPSRLGNPLEFANLISHILCNPMLNGETIRLDGALRMPP